MENRYNKEDIFEILKGIPQFHNVSDRDISFDQMSGNTNVVYRISVSDKSYLLRIPGLGSEDTIDRRVEGINAKIAADAGISAELIHFDRTSGLMVSEFIEEAVTLNPTSIKNRAGAIARVADALQKLHGYDPKFESRFEVFSMIDKYLKVLERNKNKYLTDDYFSVLSQVDPLRDILNSDKVPIVSTHCDLVAENILDNGNRVWIVDWEMSGLNDPVWDLSVLSNEAHFEEAHNGILLSAYCNGNVSASIEGRFYIYKALSNLLWTLWGFIQDANGRKIDENSAVNSDVSTWRDWGLDRLERCKRDLAHPDFSEFADAVRL